MSRTGHSAEEQEQEYTTFEKFRTITVDKDSTCLDYMLPCCLLCPNCDAFRTTVIEKHSSCADAACPDLWPTFKSIRRASLRKSAGRKLLKRGDRGNPHAPCTRPFDSSRRLYNGRRWMRLVCRFIKQHRQVSDVADCRAGAPQSLSSMVKSSKECQGWWYDETHPAHRELILQSAIEASTESVVAGHALPECFPIARAYSFRSCYEQLCVCKEYIDNRCSSDYQRKYHYVIRATSCMGSTNGPQHKFCSRCQALIPAVHSMSQTARDSQIPSNPTYCNSSGRIELSKPSACFSRQSEQLRVKKKKELISLQRKLRRFKSSQHREESIVSCPVVSLERSNDRYPDSGGKY